MQEAQASSHTCCRPAQLKRTYSFNSDVLFDVPLLLFALSSSGVKKSVGYWLELKVVHPPRLLFNGMLRVVALLSLLSQEVVPKCKEATVLDDVVASPGQTTAKVLFV